ncbi:EAL domain-containing protein [Hydrogenimonas sp.]
MRELKIDEREMESRLNALQIGDEEREILKKVSSVYEEVKREVDPVFLQKLKTLIPLQSYEKIEAELAKMQESYFSRMLEGPYDVAYAESRVRIGYIFYDAKVRPQHFVAAFSAYYAALVQAIEPQFGNEMGALSTALNKLLLLDTNLFMETYFHEDKNRFKKLYQKYSTIIDSMRDGVVVIDAQTMKIVEVNHRIESFTGMDREQLLGEELFVLHPPEFRKIIEKTLKTAIKENYGLIPEIYIVNHKSGEYQPMEVTYAHFTLDEESYIVQIVRDIKDRLSIQKKLVRLNRLYRVLSAVNELIIRSDKKESLYQEICRIIVEEGGFKFAWIAEVEEEMRLNPVAYSETAYFYKNIEEELKKAEREDIAKIVKILKAEGHTSRTEREDGIFLHEKLTIPIWHEKEQVGIPLHSGREVRAILKIYSNEVESFSEEEIRLFKEIADDISFAITTIENRQHLEFLTNFDLLTRLPNRHLFKERIDMAVYSANYQKEVFAVVLVDIDQFKLINETFGFGFGDKVILKVAEHLRRVIRPQDHIARYDSDEFALIFFNIKNEEEIVELVQRVNEVSHKPIVVDNEELFVTVSIGVSLFPRDAHSSDDLQTAAEAALKAAKRQGGNTYIFYSDNINTAIQSKIRLQNELNRALHNGEFELFYQPQVDLQTMRIVGTEALIRWNHPTRGLVAPAEFIPTLEESYLIEKVGRWVIEEACRQIRKWQANGIRIPIAVAINISTKQITRDSRFFETLLQTVIDSEIDPTLLHVEITESLIMENLEVVEKGLKLLNDYGILSAIDDFGTGYSSLFYLKKLPVYALKIDRAFIKNLPDDEEDATITRAIVSMTKSLGKKTIAEGVESEEQMAFLRSVGCDMIQGYIFAKPLPAADFERFYTSFERR